MNRERINEIEMMQIETWRNTKSSLIKAHKMFPNVNETICQTTRDQKIIEIEEIQKHLVSNALSPNQQMATCRIDMNQRENLSFEKSHTFFAPILGGEWRPPECAAEFDSRPVKVQMLINQSTTIIFFRYNHNTISQP